MQAGIQNIRQRTNDNTTFPKRRFSLHRRLTDGIVHCAGSATYQVCFRLPIPNSNPNPKP